jgi:hypothetical protein
VRFRTAHRASIKAAVAAALAVPVGILSAGAASAAPSHGGSSPSFTVTRIASGQSLTHWFTAAGSSTWQHEHLSSPDDITVLQDRLYVTFQNGVGPQGQASTDGNQDSTIVEFTLGGREVRQWDLRGKCDGLTADPWAGVVVATVNEDANSSPAYQPRARHSARCGRSVPRVVSLP